MAKLEAYDKALDYSYAPGIFPATECLKNAKKRCMRLLVSSNGLQSEGVQALERDAQEAGVRVEIRRTWEEDHYLMDTHTAVASAVLRAYQAQTGDTRQSVIVSTASPYKFGASVLGAVAGQKACDGLDDFACCRALAELTGTREPAQILALPDLPIRHTAVCEKDKMAQAVLDAVK